MTALSMAAALSIANACLPPSVAPIMLGIAQHESGLDPTLVHKNANGTLDVGLAQINTSNFGWLGLTMETAKDPCRNLAAGARVLFARYNGSPPDAVRAAYAAAIDRRIRTLDAAPDSLALVPPAPEEEDAINDTPADNGEGITPKGSDNERH